MDILVLLAYVMAGILILLCLAATLLYFIPLRTVLRVQVPEAAGARVCLTASWMSTGITVRPDIHGNQADLVVFNHVLYTFLIPETEEKTVTTQTKGTPDEHEEESVRPVIPAAEYPRIAQRLLPPVKELTTVIWQESRFDGLSGSATIGLDNPAQTGTWYGYYWASRFMLEAMRIHIDVEPVFERQVFACDLTLRISFVHPLRIIFALIALALQPSVRETAGVVLGRSAEGVPA